MDRIDFDNLSSSDTIGLLILKELQLMRQDVVASMLRMEEQIYNFNERQLEKEEKLQGTEDQSKFDNDDHSSFATETLDKTMQVSNDFDNTLECNEPNVSFPENCNVAAMVTFNEESELKHPSNEGRMPHIAEDSSEYPSTSNNFQFSAEIFENKDDKNLTLYNCLNQEKHHSNEDFSEHYVSEKHKRCNSNQVYKKKQNCGSTKSFKRLKGYESSDQHIFSTLHENEFSNSAPNCHLKNSRTNEKIVTNPVRKSNHSGQKKLTQSVSLPQAAADKDNLKSNNKVCPKCFKSYSCVSNLNRHLRSHSDERYQCPVCHKCFLRKYRLKDHLKTHFKGLK